MSLTPGAPAHAPDSTALHATVERARRRLLAQSGFTELMWGAALVLVGPILLLTFGTDVVPPATLWIFILLGAALAAYRASTRKPSPDRAARMLDVRWRTADQLSTAYAFLDRDDSAARNQRALAERVIRDDVAETFPMEWPRWSGSAFAAMLSLLTVLLIVRFGVLSSLDLRAPLVNLPVPSLTGQAPALAEQTPDPGEGEAARTLTETRDEGEKSETADPPEAEPLAAAFDPEGADEAFQMPEVEGLSAGEESGDDLSPPSAESSEPSGEEGEQSASNAPPPEESGDWSEESDSLLDRLKDAFDNMMETMQTESQEASAGESESGEGEQGGESSSESGEQAQAEESAGEQTSDAEMEGGEPSEGESQQAAEGQGSDNAEEAGQAGESAAASGTADGSKEIAEQQAQLEAALDELEEFYQERAEDVAGEILIETDSSEQTLRTEYRDTSATHADRGGDVNRDEIPAAYQAFIERYFKSLRQENPK